MNADEIAEALDVSRSNVSMGLKELQSWSLVRLEHRVGDRRDYFRAPEDVWQIFQTLAQERKKREIDPTLSMLREAVMEPVADESERYAQKRMQDMHDLIELATSWFAEVQRMDQATLKTLMKMGTRVQKVLEFKLVGTANKKT